MVWKYLAWVRGTTVDNAKTIINDLKHSWYFRIWLVVWIICFLTSFIFMTFFSARSDILTKEGVWRMSARHESQISYPAYRIRVNPTNAIYFSSISCYHGNQIAVVTSPCDTSDPTRSRCFAVNVDGSLVATSTDQAIKCHIVAIKQNITGPVDETLLWELGGTDSHFGGANFGVFVNPSDQAWVALQKVLAKFKDDAKPRTFWERKLVYQVNTRSRLNYEIDTVMDSFAVLEYNQGTRYNGWQAVGDIGGFAFFIVVMHMLVMTIVGFFLRNESNFLKSSGGLRDGAMPPMMYDNGKTHLEDDLGERAPMLSKN